MATVAAELQEQGYEVDNGVEDTLTDIASQFDKSPKDLRQKFEMFWINNRIAESMITDKVAERFKMFLRSFLKPSGRKSRANKTRIDDLVEEAKEVKDTKEDEDGSAAEVTPDKGSLKRRLCGESVEKQSTPFSKRTKVGETVSSFNAGLEVDEGEQSQTDVHGICHSTVAVLGGETNTGARYVTNTLEAQASAIEAKMEAMEEAVTKFEGQPFDDNVATPTQSTIRCVARVTPALEEPERGVDALVEGSVRRSNGERVGLNVSSLGSFALFNGQILCMEGINPDGRCFRAQRLVRGVPSTKLNNEHATAKDNSATNMTTRVITASGPFTCSDNADHEPLSEIASRAQATNAEVLVLLGPFIDKEQEQIQAVSESTFKEMFENAIADPLARLLDKIPSMRLILVPSTRDAFHLPAIPQPPIEIPNPLRRHKERVSMLGNPSVISLNGSNIGITSIDIPKCMAKHECARTQDAQEDRLPRFLSHFFQQQSFMPIFPSPKGVPVDMSKHEEFHLPNVDILVCTSDLMTFAKVVPTDSAEDGSRLPEESEEAGGVPREGGCESGASVNANDTFTGSTATKETLCINPGRAAKGTGAGTFATLRLPSNLKGEGGNSTSWLVENTRVDINRI